MERTTQAGKLGHYTWIVDEIMLEESNPIIEASSYSKPFDTDENEKGLQPATITSEFTDEFVQLVAYCIGASFAPPQFEVIRGGLNKNSKKIIKRLRKRMIAMYKHANETNPAGDAISQSLPVIPVQPKFQPKDEVV